MQLKFVLLTLSALAFAACATPSNDISWSVIEGCWVDRSDAIPPASMTWRTDPSRPGAYMGAWRVSGEQADAVDFTLTPSGAGMQFCERMPGADELCAPAVLASTTRRTDVALFQADKQNLAFGFADRPAPFFFGRRGACGGGAR